MADKYRKPPENKIDVRIESIKHLEGEQFEVELSAKAEYGNRPARGQVKFFISGASTGSPQTLDDDGRAVDGAIITAKGASISVEAQLVGTGKSDRKVANLPWPAKEEKKKTGPALMVVDATQTGNTVNFLIRVLDADEKGFSCKIVVMDGDRFDYPLTDDDGNLEYAIHLEPHKEREFSAYVSGYGKCGYEETFTGRRI